MEHKQIPARIYHYAATELTIAEIPAFGEETVEPLFQSAQKNQLDIVGPIEFIYLNSSGNPAQPFQLIIGIPVTAMNGTAMQADADGFGFLETPPFECLAVDFRGSMRYIGQAWKDLVDQAREAGYLFANQGREVYKDWHAFDAEDNVTELQMGIVAHKIS